MKRDILKAELVAILLELDGLVRGVRPSQLSAANPAEWVKRQYARGS